MKLLALVLLSSNAYATSGEIFYNGFDFSVVPTDCKTIASHTTGITNFTRWTGTQALNYTSGLSPRQADVTQFSYIFTSQYHTSGGLVFNDPVVWPGQNGILAQLPVPTNRYVSLQFTVSESGPHGVYLVGGTGYSAPYSETISTTCGDFSSPGASGSTVRPGCYKNKRQSVGGLTWNTVSDTCLLTAGQTYYVNLINADITSINVGGGFATSTANKQCLNKKCSDPILNQWSK